jgi:pilus assembly protein Flp/PilA
MSAFNKMFAILSTFQVRAEARKDEKGVTAIEYALMAGGIAVIIVAALAIHGISLTSA